jgi:hypothetical protein
MLRAAVIGLIRLYRLTLSPLFHLVGGRCRFEPSCSAYGLEAFRRLPLTRAARLTARRIARCRPGGGFGLDPVPER